MKHLLNLGFIIILIVIIVYVFKDELFYSPPKMEPQKDIPKIEISQKIKTENTNKEISPNNEQIVKKEESLKQKTETQTLSNKTEKNKEIVEVKEKTNQETNVKNEKIENITAKGKVIEVKSDNNIIRGIIEIKGEKLNFEMKYDPDILILLEDAKNYHLPLTFVIKKEGNKAYIEEIK